MKFYQENYQKLLDYAFWAHQRLDQIDAPKIEAFKAWALKHAGRTWNAKHTPDVPDNSYKDGQVS